MPNRLQHETSPYLRQHADNPVDWYAWGEDALQRARSEDKPILLSVGYSACHWCHVMAHESFEDAATAALMNKHFINIKVDREERPDVDDIYMQAVQAMTGQGGWPMTVFLTPAGKPFYGGTYFPKEPRYGIPSFTQILLGVADAYAKRRDQVEQSADDLTVALNRDLTGLGGGDIQAASLDKALQRIGSGFDARNGGFSAAPKFPQPMNLEFILRAHQRTGNAEALHWLTFTLDHMARGGIYDQLGGGFHRYSVDAHWLVPHFEKMLYDNAQLARIYLRAWQATGNAFYQRIACEIIDYVLREMTAPEGGFYSATDADSEGVEGKFFVWSVDELRELLADNATIAIEYWGVTAQGNFEGENILNVAHEDAVIAEKLGISADELHTRLEKCRDTLFAVRTQRVHPQLDDKILTAWNGMMLASLAEAARTLNRSDYREAAIRNGRFLVEAMLAPDGRLLRTHHGGISKLNGYLEDYANLIDALLELYQATFDEAWFNRARQLADDALAHFAAPEGGFYDTRDDHESLISRPRNLQDNATPSGNAQFAKQLLRLAAFTGDERYDTAARQTLSLLSHAVTEYPTAFAESLNAADMLVRGIDEIAIIGAADDPRTQALLAEVHRVYRPNSVVAFGTGGESAVPLLQDRSARNGAPTAYVCRHFTCKLPVHTPDALRNLLEADRA